VLAFDLSPPFAPMVEKLLAFSTFIRHEFSILPPSRDGYFCVLCWCVFDDLPILESQPSHAFVPCDSVPLFLGKLSSFLYLSFFLCKVPDLYFWNLIKFLCSCPSACECPFVDNSPLFFFSPPPILQLPPETMTAFLLVFRLHPICPTDPFIQRLDPLG